MLSAQNCDGVYLVNSTLYSIFHLVFATFVLVLMIVILRSKLSSIYSRTSIVLFFVFSVYILLLNLAFGAFPLVASSQIRVLSGTISNADGLNERAPSFCLDQKCFKTPKNLYRQSDKAMPSYSSFLRRAIRDELVIEVAYYDIPQVRLLPIAREVLGKPTLIKHCEP
jgi:hypothetical protein